MGTLFSGVKPRYVAGSLLAVGFLAIAILIATSAESKRSRKAPTKLALVCPHKLVYDHGKQTGARTIIKLKLGPVPASDSKKPGKPDPLAGYWIAHIHPKKGYIVTAVALEPKNQGIKGTQAEDGSVYLLHYGPITHLEVCADPGSEEEVIEELLETPEEAPPEGPRTSTPAV